MTFAGSPAAARRIVNQIGAAKDQFYVLRTLSVKNQVDKGPKRDAAEATAAAPPSSSGTKTKEHGIAFIVGSEHVDATAKIEIVTFAIPGSPARR